MSAFPFTHSTLFFPSMRVHYIPPNVGDFIHLLQTSPRGGSLSDIRVFEAPYHTRGSGLLSILKGIGRKAIPFLMQHVAPSATKMAQDVFSDMQEGKNIRSALRSRGLSALKDVGKSIVTNKGGGRVKKRKKNRKTKCYKRDIFDSLDI